MTDIPVIKLQVYAMGPKTESLYKFGYSERSHILGTLQWSFAVDQIYDWEYDNETGGTVVHLRVGRFVRADIRLSEFKKLMQSHGIEPRSEKNDDYEEVKY